MMDQDEIWKELNKYLVPETPPTNAKTFDEILKMSPDFSPNAIRKRVNDLIKRGTLKRMKYKNTIYYYPAEDHNANNRS